jgi:Flp pilus assembly pilin Flp
VSGRRDGHQGAESGGRTESGQSLAEYALIVALIVIVALVALTLFGTQINDILSMIANQING